MRGDYNSVCWASILKLMLVLVSLRLGQKTLDETRSRANKTAQIHIKMVPPSTYKNFHIIKSSTLHFSFVKPYSMGQYCMGQYCMGQYCMAHTTYKCSHLKATNLKSIRLKPMLLLHSKVDFKFKQSKFPLNVPLEIESL